MPARPARPARSRVTAPSPYAAAPWLAAYPAAVPQTVEGPDVPLTKLLDDAAGEFPMVTALAFLGTRLSYRELRDSVDRFATALAGLGLRKGDRLAIVLPNCPQNVIATYAAWRLGAIVVQHNPLYTERELEHQLVDSGAEIVVCLDRGYATVAAVRPRTSVRHVVVASLADYLPGLRRLVFSRTKRGRDLRVPVPDDAGVAPFLTLLHAARMPARQVPVEPATDLAVIQYTSGTTGDAKGAMLTHRSLVANARQTASWIPGLRRGHEVTLAVLPLFHSYGMTVCMNATVLVAGTIVLLPRFDLEAAFRAIDEFKPTLLPGVPPIYQALVDSPQVRQHDLRSVKACISGAMALPAETQEKFERVSGGRLVEGYGLTEAAPSTHANPVVGKRKAGTVGVPLPDTECRVVDPDRVTKEVPVGQPGELLVRGPQVFSGYWHRPDETAAVLLADGWLRTGDIVVMDEEGYFRVVDRAKDIIVTGGFNVAPREVEDVLLAHDAVAEVCVAGLPNRYRGETVKAYVVLRPDAEANSDELTVHCLESLAPYKVPKEFAFRDALPHTALGKALRRVLVAEDVAAAKTTTPPKKAAKKAVAKKPPAKKAAAKKPAAKKAPAKKRS